MGKEVRRIRINRLSSENNIFDEIVFHDGFNLILGEKYDESQIQGRKTNGVGKSMCIAFLDFGFLCDYDKSRVSKIPDDVFPPEENIILDLTIGDKNLIIKRNRKNQARPVFVHDGSITQFDKFADAKTYLKELIFGELTAKEVPSFRSLLSILIRDERSNFTDILKYYNAPRKSPEDLTVHLFMLGISLESYRNILETIREIENISKVLNSTKNELTENGSKKIADVRAGLNALDAELVRLEEAMDAFKSNEAFSVMEEELINLENRLGQLRRQQQILKSELDKIRSLPQPEQVDDSEIKLVYNQFQENLGDAIVKSLNDVVGFKNRVEEFQRVLVNQKASELERQIKDISGQIRILDEQYADKIRIIDQKGVLKDLKTSLRIYESKKEASAHTQFLFEQYDKYGRQKRELNIRKQQELLNIDNSIDSLDEELKSFTATISDIHEAIMGNRECSFEIRSKQAERSKIPIDINLRIYDDGSHSVDRTKVFIYDLALMFNEYTRNRHPQFLVHDNIFDVDQDTLVQSLNYIHRLEEYYSDFQYILTLNRDKIENEERRKLITMDVDTHEVAVFTKANKFLKKDYQEK